MFKEFKEFAIRGNAIDLAVGVIVGAAFGKIVDSLVNDIIMPPFGLILGNIDFSALKITFPSGTAIRYGMFLNNIISFLIISFAIFLVVKQINGFRRKEEVPSEKVCQFCKSKIAMEAVRCPHCTSDLG